MDLAQCPDHGAANQIHFTNLIDLGLGFFSTASINVLSVGFANFIVNGGKMRLYINQFLSEEDYKKLHNDCGTIRRMLISSLKTIKANHS